MVADLTDLRELGLFHDAKWVRLQLVSRDAEFKMLFGRPALLYADRTVSGRRVRYIKDYILKHVLPFYGQRACLFIPHAPPSIHASHASCSSTAPPLPVTARDEQRPAD